MSSLTITGGTAEYNLLSTSLVPEGDYQRLSKEQVRVHYTDAAGITTVLTGDDLIRRDVEWLNRYVPSWAHDTHASSLQQLPQYYYERFEGGARYLGLVPTPCTGSSASMVAYVPYVAAPPLLTSDTAEPFNGRTDLRPYHQAVVHYAASQLEKLRRDDAASDRQLQKFLAYAQQWLQSLRKRGGTSLTFARTYLRTQNRAEESRR